MRKKQEIHGISKEELVKEKLSKVSPIVAKKLTVRALSVSVLHRKWWKTMEYLNLKHKTLRAITNILVKRNTNLISKVLSSQ
jgi:hypothetical protein